MPVFIKFQEWAEEFPTLNFSSHAVIGSMYTVSDKQEKGSTTTQCRQGRNTFLVYKEETYKDGNERL